MSNQQNLPHQGFKFQDKIVWRFKSEHTPGHAFREGYVIRYLNKGKKLEIGAHRRATTGSLVYVNEIEIMA